MKMNNMQLVIDKGRFYIVEVNKRGAYRSKKDVTDDFLGLVTSQLDTGLFTVNDKQYLCAVRELDEEQLAILKESKIKENEVFNKNFKGIMDSSLISQLHTPMFYELKNRYRKL